MLREAVNKPLLAAAIAGLVCKASAQNLEISNEALAVRYDTAKHRFSAVDRATGQAFLADGQLEGQDVSASVRGRRIVVTQADGSRVTLELRKESPFLYLTKELRNAGAAETDIQRTEPASFRIELGKPAGDLRTMGTAGLMPPDQNPGSYLFLTLADPETRRGVVAGWLTHDRGDGVLFSSVKEGGVEFKARIDYGHLRIPPGKTAELETLVVGLFDDARLGEECFADEIKEHYDIRLRPRSAGYCTWYSEVGGLTDKKGGAGASNEKDLTTLTEFAARELKPYGFGFVQIDDEWQDGGSNPDGTRINGPRRGFTRQKPDGGYPRGMAPVADMIEKNGLTAGIWFLPFARNHQDPEYKDRQDWFVHRLDGTPYETVWGGTSLDLTRPDVQKHLVELVKTVHGWGFDYFKMDGLWTGSATEQIYVNDGYKDDSIGNHKPFLVPRVTNIEALRSGLKLLRKAAGRDVFFSGCCASQNMRSLGGAIGLVDSMRIGPDNGFEWQDYRKEVMHFEGGGIITGPIRGNRLYFLNGRVWWNDPDPAYVRPAVKLNHAQLLSSWVAVSSMFNLNSDWLPGLPPERLEILKRCMPSHNATARPVDYFDSPMPSLWLLSAPPRYVLGLYNWDSVARTIRSTTRKAGLDDARTYYAFDFWNNKPLTPFRGLFAYGVPAESCRVIAVRADEGHPVIVSTSRHVTQGVVDLAEETWKKNTLSAESLIVGNDPYEARIAGIDNRKDFQISVSSSDQRAGVKITPVTSEAGWLRVRIDSPTHRTVRWSVLFPRK